MARKKKKDKKKCPVEDLMDYARQNEQIKSQLSDYTIQSWDEWILAGQLSKQQVFMNNQQAQAAQQYAQLLQQSNSSGASLHYDGQGLYGLNAMSGTLNTQYPQITLVNGNRMQCGQCKSTLKMAKRARSNYLPKGSIALTCDKCGFEWIADDRTFEDEAPLNGKVNMEEIKNRVKRFELK